MSDPTITVISILAFFLILAAGTAWLFFNYLPKKTLAFAKELADTVKNTLGLPPQVTVNQKIIYQGANEILELAMLEQDFEVEYENSQKWMRSEKKIALHGKYRAKIGFNLQKGFNLQVQRSGFLKPGKITLQLPRAEILSLESLDIQRTYISGLFNWVTKQDLEQATRQLGELAVSKASTLNMLESAERQIENRLNSALLPKMVNQKYAHQVKFLEMNAPRSEELFVLPAGNPNES